ncbi:hypothetical protein [Rhizobium leguminosarum]|uniref:hypothetical protein n=1 Tax=Rhizobium leguminosarum TaxID=384 RepID=UPI0013F4156D|nr:hypothetical protein [Rhizobium leguminosarum]
MPPESLHAEVCWASGDGDKYEYHSHGSYSRDEPVNQTALPASDNKASYTRNRNKTDFHMRPCWRPKHLMLDRKSFLASRHFSASSMAQSRRSNSSHPLICRLIVGFPSYFVSARAVLAGDIHVMISPSRSIEVTGMRGD